MSRSKKIYALLGVLLVVCVATFSVSRYEEHKEKIKDSDEVVLKISGEDVTALSWEYGSEAFSFHKDEKWLYDKDQAFPVDEEKIADLLEQFEELGVSFAIEEVEDYGQYGLEAPSCTIRIETADKQFEILVGDYSDMDGERYVSVGDGNVYLAKEDPMDDFQLQLSDLILQDQIPTFDRADEIQFAGAENYCVVHEENSHAAYSDDDVYFVKKGQERQVLDTDNVQDYLQTVKDLSLQDYVTYNASDKELSSYGLDDPELRIAVQYTVQEDKDKEQQKETGSFTLSIAQDPKEKKKAAKFSDDESEDAEKITAYARVGDSGIIYEINGEDYQALLMTASYDMLRHQEVLPVAFEDIDQIDITLEGKKHRLTSNKKKKKTIWRYNDKEVKIDELRRAFTNLEAADFKKDQPEGKEEIGLTLYLDNENYPKIQMKLYRDGGSLCVAVVNGEPVAHVDRSDVVDLVEAVQAIVLE